LSSDFYTSSILPFAAIIIKICRAYTNTQEDFEDYYQEVCLQTLNVCLTLMKKDKKKKSQFDSDELPDEVTVENHAFVDESLNQLYQAIRQLSEVDRAVILLYLEEKSYQEIADIIGTNSNNIGVRIKRIKTRLKKLLTLTRV